MSINPTNLGTEVKLEQQGQGFWDDLPNQVRLSNATLSTSNGVTEWTFDASSDYVFLTGSIPCNYDEESDALVIDVLAETDDTADTIEIDFVKVTVEGGTGAETKTIDIEAGTFTTANVIQKFSFDCSGLGLLAGASFSIALGYTRAASGTMLVSSIAPRYRRNMCKTGPIKDR